MKIIKRFVGDSKLLLVDDLSPEDVAMLQALYSRSPESAETNLEKVAKIGSGKFMQTYYVGYAHKSIADCGSTTLFFEGVSMLAAKAIQQWPLYSGQETSTRYMDMTTRPMYDPIGTEASQRVLRRWIDFYSSSQFRVQDAIRQRYPRREGEDPVVYTRAVNARVFDILRGFLPAGMTTQLSWHTNLRQAADHLRWMSTHPLAEVRNMAVGAAIMLHERYPSSGFDRHLSGVSGVSDREEVLLQQRSDWDRQAQECVYYRTTSHDLRTIRMNFTFEESDLSDEILAILSKRPRGCVLPHEWTRLGQIQATFGLDFGSYRDLQRHRNGVVDVPLLTSDHGFEPWYLEELGALKDVGARLVEEQNAAIRDLTDDLLVRQYFYGMGQIVSCGVSWGLPSAIYVLELRSTRFVHATLRRRIHQMIEVFTERFPRVALHVDRQPDDWSIRRGQQTILAK
jgi:thymidylate synthase ThyX